MSDGSIKIDVKLDSSVAKKDLQEVEKVAEKSGNSIAKSFDNVEKSMKNANTAFNGKQLAKELDNVGKSIKNTTDKIELEKKKLSELKEAYEKATNPTKKNKIEADMIKAEASVIKLETKLNGLKDKQVNIKFKMDSLNGLDGNFRSAEMSAIKSLDNIEKKSEQVATSIRKNMGSLSIGEGIIKVGDKISSVGDTLTRNVTLPITAIGVAAAKVGMDFDSQMSRVKAISGSTGEEFKQLHDQALQLGKDTAFSAKAAAGGMENLAAAGFNTQETMAAMPGLLDLAAASGESLATSSDIAASTLRGFGLEASQAGHVADVLAKNANATNAAVADTGEAMKYVAPVARAMGLSLEEVTASIGEMANAGIKGSQAGTTLRSALTRLASPSDTAAAAMEQIGFKAFDSQGKLKKLSTIMDEYNKALEGKTEQQKQDYTATIFGQEAMSGMLVLMQGGKQGLDDLTDSYKASEGAAKDMATTMQDNAKSAIEQMSGSIETAAIKLEEVAAPTITKIANEIQDMANRFADLSPEMQEGIIKAALFAAALGPAAKIVGSVTSGIGKLIKLGSTLGSMLGLIGTGAEAGGAALTGLGVAGGLAAGAATALVVGIAGAVTYNELLQKSVVTSSEDLNAWERAVNACTGGVVKSKAELQKAGLVYKDFGEGVSDSFKDGIEKATQSYHDFEMTLTGANSDDKISTASQSVITGKIDSMISAAKNSINSRKKELQDELSKTFTLKDGTVSEDEQKILDDVGKASDQKLKKIEVIQKNISDIWNKAIQEHGKLSQADVEQIERYLQEVNQIKAEVEAKNTAESTFAKNQFGERLSGISGEDAAKEYKTSSDDLSKKFSDARATYKTGMDDLKKVIEDYNEQISKEENESAKKDLEEKAKNSQKVLDEKDKEYKELIEKERTKRREYLDMLYEKNPNLQGNLNEVDGTLFTKADRNTQGDLYKLKQQFSEVADATESGMKRVQDSTGKWHDIYVTVDQATGNITSAYDTFTGKFGGYSAKFADDAKATGDKAKESMNNLAGNIMHGMSNLKLDGDKVVKIDTGETVSKLQTIIEKADKTKVAIANINGVQVKIEFNKDGTIANADDILKAVVEHAKDSKALVNVDVNNKEALDKFKETEDKALELGDTNPKIETTAETSDANNKIDEVKSNVNSVPDNHTITFQARYEGFEDIGTKVINAINSIAQVGLSTKVNAKTNQNYTGTGGGEEGFTTLHEHGWEMSTGENELYYMGSGTGILDHGSSVNAMRTDVNNAVDNRFSSVVSKLVNNMISQNQILSRVENNTNQTAQHGLKNVQVNEKLANTLVSKMNTASGGFNQIQNELTNANDAKTKADKMKVEDNANYASAKSKVDDLASQIEDLKNQSQDLEDSKQVSLDKSTNKAITASNKSIEATKNEIQAKQHQLEREKDIAEKEVNLAKMVAENEIEKAKESAEEQVKIAEAKKDKLVKLADAISTAVKNQLDQEQTSAEKSINDRMTTLEKNYNKKLKALEEQSTETSRSDTRQEYSDKIAKLTNQMNNTASYTDRQALALQINDLQKQSSKQESEWTLEDKKKALEEQYNKQKETLEKQLKDTQSYYSKLKEEDSINAQSRYIMLTSSQDELVKLLQSYNPQWQNAGQSLADSLLTGLNSQKQSVEDAVSEMIGNRRTYYDVATQTIKGYASGTSSNPIEGYYLTNEQGPEMSTSGDVAYVSKNAGIKNAMQTKQMISSEISSQIARQIAQLKATRQEYQLNALKSIAGSIASSASKTVTNNNGNVINFNVKDYHQYTGQDAEATANELGFYTFKSNRRGSEEN